MAASARPEGRRGSIRSLEECTGGIGGKNQKKKEVKLLTASKLDLFASAPLKPRMFEQGYLLQGKLIDIELSSDGLILVRVKGICHACQGEQILEKMVDGSLQEKLQPLVGKVVVIAHLISGQWAAGELPPELTEG